MPQALAVVAMTMPLSEPELVSYLSRRGYTGETRDAMLAKVLVGRQGQLELTMAEQVLEKAANMFAQADMYQEEAEKLEKENQALIEKAQLLGPDILKFTEKIAELQGEMAPWEWVPEWVPLGPRAEIAETQEKLDKLTDERKALDEQIEELEGEIAVRAQRAISRAERGRGKICIPKKEKDGGRDRRGREEGQDEKVWCARPAKDKTEARDERDKLGEATERN